MTLSFLYLDEFSIVLFLRVKASYRFLFANLNSVQSNMWAEGSPLNNVFQGEGIYLKSLASVTCAF